MKFRAEIVIIYLVFIIGGGTGLLAQSTQSIRGMVIDKNTGVPLIGATILLLDHEPLLGTITDKQGYFHLQGVAVGRRGIRIDYLGYQSVLRQGLDVTAGKAFTVNIEMEESAIMGEEAEVRAHLNKGQALNEMALVSARSFNMEEAERYAGSWGDPARLVANFAGVQSPADQSNDIIIRGNSPAGLLWKMEGISIYNPNHFGSIGSTGGPISMINNNMLANSDFYSGAFPSQYGNALSGVFDLNLRSGNGQDREYTAQLGFNGFEFGAEGPFSKKSNASYLFSYRYSSLAFFEALGMNLGVPAVPYYQDLTFKVDIPLSEKGRLTVFGLGGMNHIGSGEVDGNTYDYFRSNAWTGAFGISHRHYFNEKTRLRTILSWTGIRNFGVDSTSVDGVLTDQYGQNFSEQKVTFQSDVRRRLSSRDHLVGGVEISFIRANYVDSVYVPGWNLFFQTANTAGNMMMLQSFIDWKHKFTEQLQLVAGLHYQQISLNRDLALEPRVSMSWKFRERQEISLGYGLHSQAQPRTVYFSETLVDTAHLEYVQTNKHLGFTRSHQAVLGYQVLFDSKHRLKSEFYFQKLFDVPVNTYPSQFSMINYGGSFTSLVNDSLENKGDGWNMGLELTMERFFSNHFYYLATISLFDSKYRASDGQVRNTVFNGNFIVNLLGGYEWKIGRQDALTVDGRISWAGGLRTVPIDLEASREAGKTVRDYTRAYESRDQDYFRIDLRVAYKWNLRAATLTFAADIQNVTNHLNPFFKEYNPETDQIEQVSQIGIIPAGVIRLNF